MKKLNLKAVLVFVDFKKAFDSVHREKMFKILRAYGIPDKIIDAIAAMYKDIQARVITPDGETELFDIVAGVLQGVLIRNLLDCLYPSSISDSFIFTQRLNRDNLASKCHGSF